MRDLKAHGWKLVVIFVFFGIVGSIDYQHEVKHEPITKAYYSELEQRYVRLRVQDISDQILRDRYAVLDNELEVNHETN